MCGRYALILPPEAMRQLFRFFGTVPNFPARYNIAPTQTIPVIRMPMDMPERGRELAFVRGGLVPHWSTEVGGAPLINARGESVADKPSFREAFKKRRCLVPADAFYEWKSEGKTKQPLLIRMRSKATMAFAGVWETWVQPDGAVLESAAIVTTSANAKIAELHDRMPAILGPDDWDAWLNLGGDPGAAKALIRPCQDEWLEYFPVSRDVNRVANDGPQLLEPLREDTPAAATRKPRNSGDGGQGSLF